MQNISRFITYEQAREYALSIAETKGFSPESMDCFIIGFMRGYDEGYADEAMSIAKALKSMEKLSVEEIAEATGLSIDEIQRL